MGEEEKRRRIRRRKAKRYIYPSFINYTKRATTKFLYNLKHIWRITHLFASPIKFCIHMHVVLDFLGGTYPLVPSFQMCWGGRRLERHEEGNVYNTQGKESKGEPQTRNKYSWKNDESVAKRFVASSDNRKNPKNIIKIYYNTTFLSFLFFVISTTYCCWKKKPISVHMELQTMRNILSCGYTGSSCAGLQILISTLTLTSQCSAGNRYLITPKSRDGMLVFREERGEGGEKERGREEDREERKTEEDRGRQRKTEEDRGRQRKTEEDRGRQRKTGREERGRESGRERVKGRHSLV
jgi:hypothetical protein